jgi:hypothetical protein
VLNPVSYWLDRPSGRPRAAAADLARRIGALAGVAPEQAFFVRTGASTPEDANRDVAVTLRVGFAPRRPNEFLTYDFRYHALSLTTDVVPVREAERHLG